MSSRLVTRPRVSVPAEGLLTFQEGPCSVELVLSIRLSAVIRHFDILFTSLTCYIPGTAGPGRRNVGTTSSEAWFRERIIPTERPPFVGEFSVHFGNLGILQIIEMLHINEYVELIPERILGASHVYISTLDSAQFATKYLTFCGKDGRLD
jgi:hypothetical protein